MPGTPRGADDALRAIRSKARRTTYDAVCKFRQSAACPVLIEYYYTTRLPYIFHAFRAAQSSPEQARAAQSSTEQPRAAQSNPEQPRAAQSRPEQPRAAQSRPEPPRAAQSSPEQPRAAQSRPEQPRAAQSSPPSWASLGSPTRPIACPHCAMGTHTQTERAGPNQRSTKQGAGQRPRQKEHISIQPFIKTYVSIS